MSSASSRLVELRHKTDRQLLLLIRRELNRGLTLASVAASKGSQLYIRAEKAYEKATSLLTKLEGGLGEMNGRRQDPRSASFERHWITYALKRSNEAPRLSYRQIEGEWRRAIGFTCGHARA